MKRILIIVLSLISIFVIGGYICFKIYFSPERIKERQIKTWTERVQTLSVSKDSDFTASSERAVNSFKEFRQAVFENDLNKIKNFIDFPLKSKDAGYLIDENSYNENFTEEDFDNFHSKIFNEIFIKSALKINTLELLEKSTTTTDDLKLGNETYRMTAYFQKPNELILNISSETSVEDLDWEAEHNRIYIFEILKNGNLKLKNIFLAG